MNPNRRHLTRGSATCSILCCLSFSVLRFSSLLLFLFILVLFLGLLFSKAFPPRAQAILELLPPRSVQLVAQLAIVVHFTPTVSSPFTSGHVDHKIPVLFLVVESRIFAILTAGPGGEAVNHPLLNECSVRADPGLVGIQMFQCVLLFVLPFHVLLLVSDGVPPNVQQAVGPSASAQEKGAEVKAAAVLWYDQVDRVNFAISNSGSRYFVEMWILKRVREVERVIEVDVAIGISLEVVENVRLKRVRRLHNKGIKIKPPKPTEYPVREEFIN